ncbi:MULTISPECIES: hypothetical protein [unclassified Azospirillum]|jgi:hypothetical protein|uniref:hypothetical protein n=1 Tax=unclassified Azospirillum TaxID=2630922 RepID=UPI000B6908C4|nr:MULTISPECIES: hypothetical protein [unclassified Azospirillum]SNS67835.1 hypothetical protein SAMN05880556_10984 [Azospirillum sp. RU38E]SNS86053.1 hypothetical protein SAMN05880591_10984 [Azospirillum sp. RU37A]
MSETEQIKEYVLHLEFDLQQKSTCLRYDITIYDPACHDISHCRESVLQKTGKFAGTYHLEKNSKMHVNIQATYSWEFIRNNFEENQGIVINPGFTVTDLVFVSVPAGNIRQSALSLFKVESAGIITNDWQPMDEPNVKIMPSKENQEKDNAVATISMYPKVFDVVDGDAVWQLSGYLSVQQKNLETQELFTRVYIFDPTVVVGTGGDDW